MPRTEAGETLLEKIVNSDTPFAYPPDPETLIDAIETEAAADANARLSAAHQAGIEVGRNEERARIRAAVKGLAGVECFDEPGWEGSERLVHRAAVLAIIDGEDTNATD